MAIRSLINKLVTNRWILRSLPASILLNLKSLPFRQAIRLPILLYKPRLINCSGKIIIDAPVRFGMIKLGTNCVSIFPNSGMAYENKGKITFKGRALIGNASAISVGTTGHLVIDNNFVATAALKLVCYNEIRFGRETLIGWNCLFSDTDFHRLTYTDHRKSSKGFGPISIGNNCWIANGCKIYKNVTIPDKCVVSADTILFKSFDCNPYSMICNDRPITVKATGLFHDHADDVIDYTS